MKHLRWLYLASALLWVSSSGNALYHHCVGFALVTAITATLHLVLFAKVACR